MSRVKEPCLMIPVSEVIELIESWERLKKNYSLRCSDKFRDKYINACAKLRKFNRRTYQDS